MESHPDDLDLYVMGALSDERRALVEAHVLECETCAVELHRQARLELQLSELAQKPARVLPLRRPRRRLAMAVMGLAAAAGLVALAGPRLFPAPRAPEPIVVTCPFDDHARACVDKARMHGLYVQYPQRRPVPIYENPNLAGGTIAAF